MSEYLLHLLLRALSDSDKEIKGEFAKRGLNDFRMSDCSLTDDPIRFGANALHYFSYPDGRFNNFKHGIKVAFDFLKLCNRNISNDSFKLALRAIHNSPQPISEEQLAAILRTYFR
jgi:hypothetical protein